MNVLRKVIGVLLIVGGIVLGAWLDLWVFLVGGIIQFVNGVKATPVDVHDVVWGLVRVFVLGGVGTFATIIFLVIPGLVLVGLKSRKSRRLR